MSAQRVLRLARSGVRSLPELEAVLRALVYQEVPPSELQANLDALAKTMDAVAKAHEKSGASLPELLDDLEHLPPHCLRIVRWTQDVLQGAASADDVVELAETIAAVSAQPDLYARRAKTAPAARKTADPVADAEAILRETDSRAAFERLVQAHASGRAIVPFVGAGLSAAAGYPLWRRFLLDHAPRFGVEAQVTALLDANQYEQAAQELRNAAGAAEYRSMIESTFGAGREPAGAVCLLPRITSGPVITLNYDRLIEEVYAREGMPLTVVAGPLADTFVDALHAEPSPRLLKVHGDVLEGTHRVLTAEEYRAAYEAETARLPDLLHAACVARRLLFLGCSFADQRMNDILKGAQRSSARHFAIMAADGNEKTRRLLSSLDIEVIRYRRGRYSDVEVLLEAFIAATRFHARVTSRVRNVLRKLAETIGHPLDDIRKIVEAARRPHASPEMQRVQAASDDRSVGALVRTAQQELLHCREVVVKDGAPGSLLPLIDAANEAMLSLNDSRDRERLDTAARTTKELRRAINSLLHPR